MTKTHKPIPLNIEGHTVKVEVRHAGGTGENRGERDSGNRKGGRMSERETESERKSKKEREQLYLISSVCRV